MWMLAARVLTMVVRWGVLGRRSVRVKEGREEVSEVCTVYGK